MTEILLSDVSDEETPVAAVRRAAALGQFMQILQTSWERDTAMGVTVPDEDSAKKAESRFRSAAGELGMGVSVARKEIADGIRLIVQAKEKRAYTPRKATNATVKRKGKSS